MFNTNFRINIIVWTYLLKYLFCSTSYDFAKFSPTVSELERAVVIKPSSFWGHQIRDENDLKILVIGRNELNLNLLCSWLGSYLKEKVHSFACWTRSVIEHGDSTSGGDGEIKYEDWIVGRWPNIIIYEVHTNCSIGWMRSTVIDSMSFDFKNKYLLRNISVPSIMLLELLPTTNACWTANQKNRDFNYRAKRSKTNRSAGDCRQHDFGLAPPPELYDNNPYSTISAYILPVARFYGHALISAIDSFWPAISRYSISHNFSSLEEWPISTEEENRFVEFYLEILVSKVIAPLLLDKMTRTPLSPEGEGFTGKLHPIDNVFRKKKIYYHIDHRLFANITYNGSIDARWSAMDEKIRHRLPHHIERVAPGNWSFPTPDELARAVVVRPFPSWGKPMRQEKQIRILAIGGSNTAYGVFTAALETYLKTYISESSYVLNAGRGGVEPNHFFGKKYEFEAWPIHQWPNLILFDFGMNCFPGWICPYTLDNLKYQIMEVYVNKNITPPSVLFLELLNTWRFLELSEDGVAFQNTLKEIKASDNLKPRFDILHWPATTANYRNRFLEGLSAYNPFTDTGPYLAPLARFYGYPFISAVDSLWPAFVRHYMTPQWPRVAWPLSSDGSHVTEVGAEILINRILGPFLSRHVFGHDGLSRVGD